jgi:hypothetical protein
MCLARCTPQALHNLAARLLENRPTNDVFPTFYRLNDPRAIAAACRKTGLQAQHLDLVESTPSTIMLGPLMLIEMLLIRLARRPRWSFLRGNMIAVLRRDDPAQSAANPSPAPARLAA